MCQSITVRMMYVCVYLIIIHHTVRYNIPYITTPELSRYDDRRCDIPRHARGGQGERRPSRTAHTSANNVDYDSEDGQRNASADPGCNTPADGESADRYAATAAPAIIPTATARVAARPVVNTTRRFISPFAIARLRATSLLSRERATVDPRRGR